MQQTLVLLDQPVQLTATDKKYVSLRQCLSSETRCFKIARFHDHSSGRVIDDLLTLRHVTCQVSLNISFFSMMCTLVNLRLTILPHTGYQLCSQGKIAWKTTLTGCKT